MLQFRDPAFLLLSVLPILLLLLQRKRKRHYGTATGHMFASGPTGFRTRLVPFSRYSWALGMVLLALALARPQSGHSYMEYMTRGVDIVLTLDCSSSMLSEDFKPNNRFHVAKEVVKDFVSSRPNDRLGLVVFSGEAFTQCPLTLDHGVLLTFLEQASVGMMEDGTAVGNAVAVAVDRLRGSEAKSKVIVLLTDGKNNRGEIAPMTAAEIAKTYGIKIYTVGVGIRGMAMMPVNDPVFGRRYVQVQVDIDEDTLTRMAELTGGKYFRATDPDKLKDIYNTIGQMEKSTVKMKQYTSWNDHYVPLLIGGLSLVFLSLLMDMTLLRRIP